MAYVPSTANLPRSLDVVVNISSPQTEARTNLTVLCLAAENLGFLWGSDRIRYYSTMTAVSDDFAAGSEVVFAATNFFAQSPRSQTFAVGEVFLDPQPARLVAPPYSAADITAIAEITSGSLNVTVSDDGVDTDIVLTGLNFSTCTDVGDIATVIDTAIVSGATCYVKTLPGGEERLVIESTTSGDGMTISYGTSDKSGATVTVDILALTEAEGAAVYDGYTPTGIADELTNIYNAADNSGTHCYGFCLGASLRVAATQIEAATWAIARTVFMPLVTNDPNALLVSYTTDIGSVIGATDNKRVDCIYHDNAQMYPDVSILAYMLGVNYSSKNSVVTAKFKQLPGITTVALTETQWSVLQSKGYSSYTAIGNSARTFRDGVTESNGWNIDTTINMDNFSEDLSLNVFNVFLRNAIVPYTLPGQMLLVDACKDTGNQYVFNGTFADREEADLSKAGTTIVPAVQVIPTPLSNMSSADRVSRTGPPIQMIVQLAGAIESIAINVQVVS